MASALHCNSMTSESLFLWHLLALYAFYSPTASWDYTKTVIDFSHNETEATIIEVNPSTYNIRMFAKNSLGTSKASNVLTITTGETGAVFL